MRRQNITVYVFRHKKSADLFQIGGRQCGIDTAQLGPFFTSSADQLKAVTTSRSLQVFEDEGVASFYMDFGGIL